VDATARLDAVCELLDRLAPADHELIAPLLPPWVRRASRMAQRDAEILALIGTHYLPDCSSGRGAAAACARDLRRYRASGWRFEQRKTPGGDARRAAWHRILSLNAGQSGRSRSNQGADGGFTPSWRRKISAGKQPKSPRSCWPGWRCN
jgi:hypothetical protein